jgi:ribose transport system substrate-binding protein
MKRVLLVAAGLALGVGALAAQQPTPAKRNIKITLIAKSAANFVFLSAKQGAEDTAKALSRKHGVRIEVVWMTPPRENAAVDRNVAVMTFDSDAPGSKRFTFYGTEDDDLGEKLTADVAELLAGKGKIAVLAGNPNAPNLKARVEGVRKAVAKHKEMEVAEVVHHVETPQDAVTAVLKVHAARPDLAGWVMVGGWPLFRSSQTPALIAELQKRRHPKIVAVDALPDQLYYVEKDLVPVLWAQPTYKWGEVGVTTIVDKLLLGKTAPEKIRMDLVRVTRKNLGSWSRQLKDWGFTGIPQEYLSLN